MKKFVFTCHNKGQTVCVSSYKAYAKYDESSKVFVVSFRYKILSNRSGFEHLSSCHEEADTKLILHAHCAAVTEVQTIDIHSPDTDVFILALRRLSLLAPNTSFVTGTCDARRCIPLNPIHEKLSNSVEKVLPGFHNLSGCDQTGEFAGKGKLLF